MSNYWYYQQLDQEFSEVTYDSAPLDQHEYELGNSDITEKELRVQREDFARSRRDHHARTRGVKHSPNSL